MRRHGDLNQETVDLLGDALEARNYIAHQFFIRNTEAFKSESEFTSTLELLDQRTEKIAAATVVMNGFVQEFGRHFNIKTSEVLVRQDAATV
jgi:hypothetical protein